ncbi:MAG: hypothetical protein H0T76_19245 [Nannocystis sp.]|nr:hypothetical protein [Nannocystis sp.]MBA3548626.1 hypothetical protein [Nannocystis sp.]
MFRRSLALLTLLAGCTSPAYDLYLEHADDAGSTSDSSGNTAATTGDATPTSTGGIGSEGADATGDTPDATDTAPMSDSATDSATDSGDATDTEDSPPVGEPDKPVIVSIELPANVYTAGPVPLAVQAEHTGSVSVTVDGADAGELIAAGGGLFTGALPIRGAIDNGAHAVEVTAKQGPYEVSQGADFSVATPAPGTVAWSFPGPDGSRTNRVAVTPEDDLIEVGQTLIGGVPRPTIRKRSGTTGAELWPEKTITLDTREGAAVDVAVLPDGRMWVAMNVRPPGKDQRARIVLLDADGHATGVELEATAGQIVRALAVDAEGGCFAVGLAGVMGDWDIAYWRIDAAGVPTLGDTFDYKPEEFEPHSFVDLASDVVIDGDVAWVVGMSKGEHDNDLTKPLRGILVPMNVHTGPLGLASVAPADNGWPQSAFFGAALHPEGVVTTGYRCDKTCSNYEILTSRYGVDGKRVWFENDAPTAGLAYGSDVVLDSQGRALVAGAVMQNGKLRGYVFGRKLDVLGPPVFDHWYPGVGPSEALGIVRDRYDRILPAGYITVSGETQARVTRIHG